MEEKLTRQVKEIKRKLRNESKIFNDELSMESTKTIKNMNSNPDQIKEIIDDYAKFVDEKYTKNKLKLHTYLKRYSFLKYKDGYNRNIMIGIVGAYIFFLVQELFFPLNDIVSKLDIKKFFSYGIFAALFGGGMLILTVVFIIAFFAFLCYHLVLTFDKGLYTTFSNPLYEILVQIEIRAAEKVLKEEFNLKF